MQLIHVRFDAATIKALRDRKRATGVPITEQIRRALRDALVKDERMASK